MRRKEAKAEAARKQKADRAAAKAAVKGMADWVQEVDVQLAPENPARHLMADSPCLQWMRTAGAWPRITRS